MRFDVAALNISIEYTKFVCEVIYYTVVSCYTYTRMVHANGVGKWWNYKKAAK